MYRRRPRIILVVRKGLPLFLILVTVLGGAAGTYLAWGMPKPVVNDRFYWEQTGAAVWDGRVSEPLIALTFDDGPDPDFTPQVLTVLREFKVKATFFMVGNLVEAYPEVAREVATEGHEIGNHTYSHPSLTRIDAGELRQELIRADRVITAITGQQPRLFRPPGGYYDETVISTARDLGYRVVIWSWKQDTKDWGNPGARGIVRRVLQNARPGDIILLHDGGGNRSQTVQALAPLLTELQKREFKLVTVSELLQHDQRQMERAGARPIPDGKPERPER
ncbi:MAG: polysaccharide deacetylase family protein [Clostridia bacterium]|nr:MAG: polysaccharide deacetylase family protein [Clostridia bacterium]